ncbi:MAG: restriction endonuclease subunit S [Bacteroidota bacterium]
MMKAEKNIPALRFPEFEGEWGKVKLEQITNRIGDGLHGTPEYVEDGNCFFINGNNLVNGRININEQTKMVSQNSLDFHQKGLNEETILISINGTIGSLARYNQENVMLGKSVGYFIFREESEFFFHHLSTEKIQRHFFNELTGTTIKNLSLKTLRETIVGFPSLPEQQKIASFLSSVDQRIHLLTQKKEKLEQYKKGIMQQIFSQQLRFKDENGKNYPAWEEKRLGDIAVINPRIDKVPDNFHYIDLESVDKGSLKYAINYNQSDAPSRAQRVLTRGDILFQLVRPYQKNNYYFDLEGTYVASTGYAQIRYDRCPQFVYQMVHSEFFVTKVLNRCTGSSYPAINSSDLGDITELFPRSFEEQQKIATFLSAIDEKINHINSQIELTRKWKQGLLQQMFV